MANKTVFITGARGFLGSALLERLLLDGIPFQSLPRNRYNPDSGTLIPTARGVQDGLSTARCSSTLIHLAGITYIDSRAVKDHLGEFRKVNVLVSERIARKAASEGIKRFVFVSSVKAMGEGTGVEGAYRESTPCKPEDDYGQSKYEAEEAVKKVATETGMEFVIIRPPLIYGPGVKANFRSLLKLSKLPVPLPFGLVRNKRSMVYTGNVVDFIIRCVDHPDAANQTFLVSDGQDLSLFELIRTIRKFMNRPSWLLPVPVWLFKLAGRLTGKAAMMDRLVGDLQVDSGKAQKLLDWTPPCTVEEGIKATVTDFNNRK